MDDVNNLNPRRGDTVEDQILANWEAPVSRTKFVSFASGLGEVTKHLEVMCEQVNEAVSGGFVVRGDMRPDI